MINLDLFPSSRKNDPYQEGVISDTLKSEANIDPKKIKEDWKDASAAGKIGVIANTEDKAASAIQKGMSSVNRNLVVQNQSIVARARNSVLQFPIYVTQTLRVNEAHIIGKLFERVYTTLVQTVLSNNKIISEEEANDLVFLKQFHTNIKEAADVLVNKYYEPIDDMDSIMCESIFYTQKITESCSVSFSVVPTNNRDLILENARLINEPLFGFGFLMESPQTLPKKHEKEVTTSSNERIHELCDDDFRDMANAEVCKPSEEKFLNETENDIRSRVSEEWEDKRPEKPTKKLPQDEWREYRRSVREWENKRDKAIEDEIKKHDDLIKKRDDMIVTIKEKIQKGEYGKRYQYSKGRYVRIDTSGSSTTKISAVNADRAIDAPVVLKDGDIKKFNGLLPYTIEATFRMRTASGNDTDVKYIIGIKSVLHLIRVQDLSDDLKELIDGNMKSLQKVRYKTGEISAMDYFFNIKGLKADASKHINYNKRWINTLKRLGEYNKMYGSLMKKPIEAITGGNAPVPNGTLVLSMADLTILTNQTGIDLSAVNNSKRLMKSLFLIAVCIVDSSAGTMRVLFDKDDDWDVQSLASVDSELAKTDNSKLMSELNNMINRGK